MAIVAVIILMYTVIMTIQTHNCEILTSTDELHKDADLISVGRKDSSSFN